MHILGEFNAISILLSLLTIWVLPFFKSGRICHSLLSSMFIRQRFPLVCAILICIACLYYIIYKGHVHTTIITIYCVVLLATTVSLVVELAVLCEVFYGLTLVSIDPEQNGSVVYEVESRLTRVITQEDWIELSDKYSCCGLVSPDDVLGRNTTWSGSYCLYDNPSSCSVILDISCRLSRRSLTDPH